MKRLLVLVLLLGVAGCGDDDSSGPDTGNQLVVGALLSLTGPGQTLGRTSEAALALAADDVNARLTDQGSPVRVSLRVEDTGLDPTRALDRLRTTFRWKCADLDAAGLRATAASSDLTLGGLLKHLGLVEDHSFQVTILGGPMPPAWDDAEDVDGWEFDSASDDSPEQLYELWDSAVARSRA